MAKADQPKIADVAPLAAIPGGEFLIRGKNLLEGKQPSSFPPLVTLDDVPARLSVTSQSMLMIKVPEGISAGELIIRRGNNKSDPYFCKIGVQIADQVHPVANPVVDHRGNIYTTLSGARGQKTPTSVYKIDQHLRMKPVVSDIINATGLALDSEQRLYVSSRHEGEVYEVEADGKMSVYSKGMGVATGLAFDQEENLLVGDRSGTIFRINREREIFVFATLEPSISAYHLAVSPDNDLFVTGPTTSSYDNVYRINDKGEVSVYFKGLGRPQGMAFDAEGNLYVVASYAGKRGVVKIDSEKKASLVVSGSGLVGLAFTPDRQMVLTSTSAVFRVDVDIEGLGF
jgi:sugar lactone lactonase YvrE